MDAHDSQPALTADRASDAGVSSPIEILLMDAGGVLVPLADPASMEAVAIGAGDIPAVPVSHCKQTPLILNYTDTNVESAGLRA